MGCRWRFRKAPATCCSTISAFQQHQPTRLNNNFSSFLFYTYNKITIDIGHFIATALSFKNQRILIHDYSYSSSYIYENYKFLCQSTPTIRECARGATPGSAARTRYDFLSAPIFSLRQKTIDNVKLAVSLSFIHARGDWRTDFHLSSIWTLDFVACAGGGGRRAANIQE